MSLATAAATLDGVSLPGAYRNFELPWTADSQSQQRLRRVGGVSLLLFLLAALGITFLPVSERVTPPALPEEVVQLVLEPPPEPPKPPKPEPKKPEPKPAPTKATKPVDRVQEARRKAESVGVLALKDELKALRDAFEPTSANIRNLEAKTDGPSRAERSILTSSAGAASGGVSSAPASRGFGGGAGSLKGVGTTQASPSFGDKFGRQASVQREGNSGKAARSREEVELMFDRNKSALYALYNRALRDLPALQGKLVVQLTIAPNGEVTEAKVLSSELGDAELERRIIARIRGFRFEARDVEPLVARKTIEFFPA
jgi:protein TonB